MKAYLGLQDGTVFEGTSIGATGETIGEIVFMTSMSGYQEVLTDPSFAGQIITMTYPLIGNYGVNKEDQESLKPACKGFVAQDISDTPNNFRAEENLDLYLKQNNIVGIQGIDTRKLTRIIRKSGTMNAIISTNPDFDLNKKIDEVKAYIIKDPVKEVTRKEFTVFMPEKEPLYHIVLIDYGTKQNIIRSLLKRNCKVTVVPSYTKAQDIINLNPDGIMLSNGPGDPKDNTDSFPTLKELYKSDIPIFGICIGHQLMALALGGDTTKLKFGHRGGNHPVKDIDKDRVYITSQNHGYAVVADSVKDLGRVTHINMHDDTVEGIEYCSHPVRTVQFHPEASPGPQDTAYLFDEFLERIKTYRENK